MLDLVRLHRPIAEELRQAFDDVLSTGGFIGGPKVAGFEEALARHLGADFAIGTSSGTDALLVSLMALGVGPGDEVITTPYTFFATAGAIVRAGATPVFADIDPATLNIDPEAVAARVTARTAGIVPVHLFGRSADMDPILELARDKGLFVLEDAAQAIGATYKGRPAGTMGVTGTLSFFPAKNLGALGDAGAVLTSDPELAEEIRSLRLHGAKRKYFHDAVGGNFRLDALQAALLSVKLPRLAEWEAGRRRVARSYDARLEGVPDLALPPGEADGRHVYNQYVVRSPRRDRLREKLAEAGVATAVYYPLPLHLQECFAALGYGRGDFPEAERAAKETLALPIDPNLDAAAVEMVAGAVRKALS